jgi:signal transduction histidine kinase
MVSIWYHTSWCKQGYSVKRPLLMLALVAWQRMGRKPRIDMLLPAVQRLSVQLALVAVVPILLVSGAISVPLIFAQRDQLREQAQLRLVQASRMTDAITTERLAFATLLADLLADRPVLTASLEQQDRPSLQAFVRQTRGGTLFDLVTLVDRQGQLLAQDGRTELWEPVQAASSPSLRGVPGIGLIVQVSHPILGGQGLLGTLVGTYVLDDAFMATIRTNTDLDQSLLVGDQLVATSLAARAMTTVATLHTSERVPDSAAPGTSLTVDVQLGGTPYLARYTPLLDATGEPIGLIEVLLPLEPVRAAQNQATLWLVTTSLASALAAIALAWLLARRFTQPVRALAQVADGLAGPGLAQPLRVEGPAEVRVLSHAIERMRQQLYASQTALATEKAYYANILESVEEAIVILDRDECVASLNRSAELLLGWERQQAAGQPLAEIVVLDADERLTLAHIPLTGSVRLAIRTPDGQPLLVSATRATLSADDAVGRHEQVLVLHDMSDEAAIGRLKEEFLANITHEFRTPLAALIASLEILREDDTLTAAERQQMIGTIHVGTQRLDLLVRNLLDSASLHAGYFHVDPAVGQLVPLIDEAIETIRPLAQQRNQTIELRRPFNVPTVLVDDRRVLQVLVNLLSNASKFGPHGDALLVCVSVHADSVTVGVTDHGPGIAPARRTRLFDRFLRPGPETMRAQGVGLGLAIVKAIVERHGGQISVESSEGAEAHETTFLFTVLRANDERHHEDSAG